MLPALPPFWKTGEIRGLRARGGYTVDMKWEDSKLVSAKISADKPQKVNVRYGDKVKKNTGVNRYGFRHKIRKILDEMGVFGQTIVLLVV